MCSRFQFHNTLTKANENLNSHCAVQVRIPASKSAIGLKGLQVEQDERSGGKVRQILSHLHAPSAQEEKGVQQNHRKYYR